MNETTRLQPSRTLLVIYSVTITLIAIALLIRFGHPFIYNPLESLWSDPQRHFNNAFDVKCQDLAAILNAPGFEVFLSTVLRFTAQNRTLISLVMAALSVATPYLWYRFLRESTRDKTISLIGFAAFAFLPSYMRIFGYFMDSVILLPLAGAALWLTWRAARKGTWKACLLAAIVAGCTCATKTTALIIVCLPWLYVGYKIYERSSLTGALKLVVPSVAIVLAIYGLGPLKVWTHTGAIVLMPDGLYNQRYFESGAKDIQVTNSYKTTDGGEWVAVSIWGSSSCSYPPFHPFSEWMTSRKGRYYMHMNYRDGRDFIEPIEMRWEDRLRHTCENIIFLFFQYQWPEDNDWQDPFPRNLPTMVRFIWLPLTLFVVAAVLLKQRREFMGWYFIAVTLVFMFQQTAVMEGRYKKLWEGVALVAFFNVVARSKTYGAWRDKNWVPVQQAFPPLPVIGQMSQDAAGSEREVAGIKG